MPAGSVLGVIMIALGISALFNSEAIVRAGESMQAGHTRDVVLSVLAHTVCAALRRRLPGYATATPDTLQRRFLTTGGHVLARRNQIVVRLDRRTYSPVLRQADLPQTLTIPWLDGRTLRYEYA